MTQPDHDDIEEESVIWQPQPGSQELFLSSPIFETLYHGNRGNGKTDNLIIDFAQHVGQGFGAEWRGVIFRETYPQLKDVVNKSTKIFKRAFPGATYNKSEHEWTFPTGEVLLFRHMKDPSSYWDYHGHAYPFIGWEELCNWVNDECFKVMMSCCRSTVIDMPRKYRATTNPYGPGHNWVKKRYQLPDMTGKVIRNSLDDEGNLEPPRVAIKGMLSENKILLRAEPEYIARISAAARNKAERRAWLYCDWNVTAGGMFDDIWEKRIHVVPSFPYEAIPKGWHIDRSYDHGQSVKRFVEIWVRR